MQDGGRRTFIQKAWGVQHSLERKWGKLGKGRYARVLRMARKPEPEEYRKSALIVLVGLGIIGAIGFAMFLALQPLTRWFA